MGKQLLSSNLGFEFTRNALHANLVRADARLCELGGRLLCKQGYGITRPLKKNLLKDESRSAEADSRKIGLGLLKETISDSQLLLERSLIAWSVLVLWD